MASISRDGTSDIWQAGMSSDNSCVIRASGATHVLTVNQNSNTSISGDLEVGGIMHTTKMDLTNEPTQFPLAITNTGANWFQGEYIATANEVGCLFRYKTSGSSTYWWSGVWGSNTDDFNMWFTFKGLSIKSNGSAAVSGNLGVGVGAASSMVKAHVIHAGSTGHIRMDAKYRNQSFLSFDTTFVNGFVSLEVTNDYYMYCGHNLVHFYKTTSNVSDDRLKGNEELIANVCGTLSKLRPQLYDKKQDMVNNDPTSWYKESGLIAQEIYYDAPELRHLVHRGKPDLDEEGNSIPLPEIPTSIDP